MKFISLASLFLALLVGCTQNPGVTCDSTIPATAHAAADIPQVTGTTTSDTRIALNRLFEPGEGFHFYTTSCDEAACTARKARWKIEGIEGYLATTAVPGSKPLHRLWSGRYHLYTTNEAEVANLQRAGWALEESPGYIATEQLPGTKPLYRWWHVNRGDHFYTTNSGETSPGYQAEGIAGYVWTEGSQCPEPRRCSAPVLPPQGARCLCVYRPDNSSYADLKGQACTDSLCDQVCQQKFGVNFKFSTCQ